ncbi:MAG: HEAT repeat domain-containing protein [Promethearchaeota archaeon]|nr:MAG: HEAT repeat domain-containing protein [Candidatus Lokiarchaeota archaeon]
MEEQKWDYVEISQIDDKIIKILINNLKLDMSENFYLSFESLLKLGKKAETQIDVAFKEMDEYHQFKKEIFKLLLKSIREKKHEYPMIVQLYNPDFLIRAKAVMEIGKKGDDKYLNFLIPMILDPDDSVRWAVINLLVDKYLDNAIIRKMLKNQITKESNPVIRKKLEKTFQESQ